MSDPFRDDNDAAIARADALQAELDRTKAENERLAQRLEVAEDKAKKLDKIEAKARKPPKPPRTAEQLSERKLNLMLGGGITGAVVVIMLIVAVPGILQTRKYRAWKIQEAAHKVAMKRWTAKLQIARCLDGTATSEECKEHVAALIGDPDLPGTEAALRAWQEDPKAVEPMRTIVLPAALVAIEKRATAFYPRTDERYWRAVLGVRLQLLAGRVKRGESTRSTLVAEAREIIALVQAAPASMGAAITERHVTALADGTYSELALEVWPMFEAIDDENEAPFPPLPPKPDEGFDKGGGGCEC